MWKEHTQRILHQDVLINTKVDLSPKCTLLTVPTCMGVTFCTKKEALWQLLILEIRGATLCVLGILVSTFTDLFVPIRIILDCVMLLSMNLICFSYCSRTKDLTDRLYNDRDKFMDCWNLHQIQTNIPKWSLQERPTS